MFFRTIVCLPTYEYDNDHLWLTQCTHSQANPNQTNATQIQYREQHRNNYCFNREMLDFHCFSYLNFELKESLMHFSLTVNTITNISSKYFVSFSFLFFLNKNIFHIQWVIACRHIHFQINVSDSARPTEKKNRTFLSTPS